MFETKNKVRQRDLEELIQNPIFNKFRGSSVLVTGATGLIGSEIVLSLLLFGGVKVVALVRNLEKAKKVFKCVLDNPNLEIVVQDINNSICYPNEVHYIVHTANTTSSQEMVTKPVETSLTIINGTKNILEFAKEKQVKAFCYLSSLEVYGDVVSDEEIAEDYLGSLDLTNPRSSYPEGKRMAESLCASYASEFGVNVKIARLTQTFGAGVTKEDNRVFAQFAKSVIQKEDIVLHTEGNSLKNYCYLTDTVSAILTLLIRGKAGEIYNVANSNTAVSIRELAEMLTTKYKTKVVIQLDNTKGYANSVKIKLSTKKLENLDWSPKIGIEEMFERLIESLKEEEYDS